ncbi:alpha/beta fold hydrolase [Streptomyces violaceusniger]|uniref:Alpha/beta hydrolase fold protein n=1 Tax=Streptomyces violaceusniger (strain Tu 4113) TaxID=653045 RepID=G2P0F0_STRV4|nr:alpha/beta hydrolase [Streptomyces violaceusniger]AEM85948.1 alpha/beta hydrolase fold protein [Streptomyces violaceusniger Tu 4113]
MSRRHTQPARRSRRALLALAAATALAAAAVPTLAHGASGAGPAAVSAAGTSSHAATKPTVVLVHGAWADSSSWSPVIDRLQAQGYPVQALANPLRGLASDAAYVKSRIESIDGPVVLVGHSYGGAVISEAAAQEHNVKALVYAAAFAPAKGETVGALAAKDPGSHATPDALNPIPFDAGNGASGVDVYIKPDKYRDVFAGSLSARKANSLAAVQRPINAAALEETVTDAAWQDIPSWYLMTRQDHALPPATQRFMAERAHAHIAEVNAPHAVMLTRPDTVTSLILHAATATR